MTVDETKQEVIKACRNAELAKCKRVYNKIIAALQQEGIVWTTAKYNKVCIAVEELRDISMQAIKDKYE